MIRRTCLTAALLFLCLPHGTRAEGAAGLSGVALMNYCAGHYDVDAGFCAGYVTAIADILKSGPPAGYRACNLGPVPSQQLMELLKLEGVKNTPPASGTAIEMTASILARSYPCR